jgi:hypothetical protein
LRGPISAIGRLYGPTGRFYRRGREPGRGFARGGGRYGLGGELGGLDGRGRELYRPAGELGGPARGGELSRGLTRGGEGGYRLGGEL